ncbi:hypothetical protein DVH24_027625 [Malus domestica]|uniref:Uncharacterized protein n=1 Tax=Malus domestica TaxID=3750 RepID=A0A498H7V8_MALDO|nr:hypothetical protein DVH24_027625 [Malus domestica]
MKEKGKVKDDALKIRLVYSVNVVLIGAKSNIVVNLDYFHLVEDMNRFNDYSCGAITFEQLQDILSLALLGDEEWMRDIYVNGDDEEEEEGKANKRGQRARRGCKGFTYAFQLNIKLRVKN